MTIAQVVELHLRSCNTSWDFHPSERYSFDDISLDKVNTFIGIVNRVRPTPLVDSPLDVMRKYGLTRDMAITNGCYLLFAAHDIPSVSLELGRFQDSTTIKDSARYKGDLFGAVDTALNFIFKHINRPIVISGKAQHDEHWEYPEEALREVLVNAVVHRDYTARGDTIVKVLTTA